MDLEEVSEPGGTDDYESAPTTPLPVLGRGIPHQLRVVSPMSPMTQTGGDFQADIVDLNDSCLLYTSPSPRDS